MSPTVLVSPLPPIRKLSHSGRQSKLFYSSPTAITVGHIQGKAHREEASTIGRLGGASLHPGVRAGSSAGPSWCLQPHPQPRLNRWSSSYCDQNWARCSIYSPCADPGTTNSPLGSRPTKQAQHMHAPTSLGVTNVLLRNREEPVLMKTTITGGHRSQASLIWNLYLYFQISKNQGVVSQISCSASQLLKNTKPLPLQSLHSAVVGDFN